MSKTTAYFAALSLAVPATLLTFWVWIWVDFVARRAGIHPSAVFVGILWAVYARAIYNLLTKEKA